MSGVDITVTFDRSEWLSLLRSPVGPVFRDLQLRGTAVKNRAQRLCPVDNGRLKKSIEVEMAVEGGVPVARVGTNVEYALYVHEGTGIHGSRGRPITPVRAKALRFTAGRNGPTLFRRQVAGQRGVPFLTDALDAAEY